MTLPPMNYESRGTRNAVRSKKHRDWIKKHLCILFERKDCSGPVDVAHCRDVVEFNERGGMGAKPSDVFTVSLCRKHHRESEKRERAFGAEYGIDMRAKCLEFAKVSPDKAIREAAKAYKP